MKKIVTILLACFLLVLSGCNTKQKETKYEFTMWNKDGVINELVNYVEDVTNEKSENFIPKEDRIAVFDVDGTLYGEQAPIYYEWMIYCQRVLDDPTFEASSELKDLAKQILDAGKAKSIPENIEEDESHLYGVAFDDMLVSDYKEYIKNFLEKEVDGFDNLKYKDMFYQPMKEVLEYLDQNDFIIYLVSGTDRDSVRLLADEFYHIPYYQVIGTDCYNEGSNHDDVNYLEYQYDDDEEVMRDSTRIIKNVKASKIMQMYQEIGQKPVLAFGNSSGDQSMFTFTSTNEKYKTEVFCLVPDDDVREYASLSKVEKLTKKCNEKGWNVISMKDDFLVMYGDEVTKNPNKYTYTDYLLNKYEESK